jgi:predicted transcriptional regulator
MSPKRSRLFSRIAITLPQDTLTLADRLAREQDRSRSWVVAEGIRRLAEEGLSRTSGGVREARTRAHVGRAQVAEARLQHLEADLRLVPEGRLGRAQELVRLARLVHPRANRAQIIGFDSFDDFATWKKSRQVAG